MYLLFNLYILKIIETKMEQFKVCEKDTKTKAYSKEGLARETKLDPREQEKDDKREWINECLGNLNDLIEAIEADIEKVTNGKAKGKSLKEAVEKYENRILKNRFHITRLEQILKLVENDDLEPSSLDDIKDDVEYYIECAAEDDGALGVDDEFDIYEDLHLDAIMLEAEEKIAKSATVAVTVSESVTPVVEPSVVPSDSIKKSIVVAATTPAVISSIGKALPLKNTVIPTPVVKSVINTTKPVIPVPQLKSPVLPIANTIAPRPIIPSTTKIEKKIVPSLDGQNDGNNNLIGSLKLPISESEIKGDLDSSPSITSSNSTATSWATATQRQPNVVSSGITSPLTNKGHLDLSNPSITPTGISSLSNPTSPPPQQSQVRTGPPPVSQSSPQLSSSSTNSIQYQNRSSTILSPETLSSIHMLKQSMINLPEVIETDKSTIYTPRNSYNTHPSFPTQPPSMADSAALFERLPMDALFLAFYYQQGTYQQHLASKQLKKHSWRFHKKYMTWFQRHEEPKIASAEFEEGTYVYFDYESGWCQRIKSEFKFEYAYLEDEVLSAPSTLSEKTPINSR